MAVAPLGLTKFDAEFAAGRGLSRHEALRLALGESRREVATRAQSGAIGVLGKREAEVAQLVADGLTNKQIGVRFLISESVASHIRSILNKLGFNSRAQIAGWVGSANP